MPKTFLTADSHHGHANILDYCDRPFADVNEMDNELIHRWNEVVGPEDTVYHLGDFALGNAEEASCYFRRLNGKIHVLSYPWHHDYRWLPSPTQNMILGYVSASGHYVVMEPPIVVLRLLHKTNKHHQTLTLCHFAMTVWPQSHYGSLHAFGHSHGRYKPNNRSIDVGVDCWNYAPVSLDAIVEILESRECAQSARTQER